MTRETVVAIMGQPGGAGMVAYLDSQSPHPERQ